MSSVGQVQIDFVTNMGNVFEKLDSLSKQLTAFASKKAVIKVELDDGLDRSIRSMTANISEITTQFKKAGFVIETIFDSLDARMGNVRKQFQQGLARDLENGAAQTESRMERVFGKVGDFLDRFTPASLGKILGLGFIIQETVRHISEHTEEIQYSIGGIMKALGGGLLGGTLALWKNIVGITDKVSGTVEMMNKLSNGLTSMLGGLTLASGIFGAMRFSLGGIIGLVFKRNIGGLVSQIRDLVMAINKGLVQINLTSDVVISKLYYAASILSTVVSGVGLLTGSITGLGSLVFPMLSFISTGLIGIQALFTVLRRSIVRIRAQAGDGRAATMLFLQSLRQMWPILEALATRGKEIAKMIRGSAGMGARLKSAMTSLENLDKSVQGIFALGVKLEGILKSLVAGLVEMASNLKLVDRGTQKNISSGTKMAAVLREQRETEEENVKTTRERYEEEKRTVNARMKSIMSLTTQPAKRLQESSGEFKKSMGSIAETIYKTMSMVIGPAAPITGGVLGALLFSGQAPAAAVGAIKTFFLTTMPGFVVSGFDMMGAVIYNSPIVMIFRSIIDGTITSGITGAVSAIAAAFSGGLAAGNSFANGGLLASIFGTGGASAIGIAGVVAAPFVIKGARNLATGLAAGIYEQMQMRWKALKKEVAFFAWLATRLKRQANAKLTDMVDVFASLFENVYLGAARRIRKYTAKFMDGVAKLAGSEFVDKFKNVLTSFREFGMLLDDAMQGFVVGPIRSVMNTVGAILVSPFSAKASINLMKTAVRGYFQTLGGMVKFFYRGALAPLSAVTETSLMILGKLGQGLANKVGKIFGSVRESTKGLAKGLAQVGGALLPGRLGRWSKEKGKSLKGYDGESIDSTGEKAAGGAKAVSDFILDKVRKGFRFLSPGGFGKAQGKNAEEREKAEKEQLEASKAGNDALDKLNVALKLASARVDKYTAVIKKMQDSTLTPLGGAFEKLDEQVQKLRSGFGGVTRAVSAIQKFLTGGAGGGPSEAEVDKARRIKKFQEERALLRQKYKKEEELKKHELETAERALKEHHEKLAESAKNLSKEKKRDERRILKQMTKEQVEAEKASRAEKAKKDDDARRQDVKNKQQEIREIRRRRKMLEAEQVTLANEQVEIVRKFYRVLGKDLNKFEASDKGKGDLEGKQNAIRRLEMRTSKEIQSMNQLLMDVQDGDNYVGASEEAYLRLKESASLLKTAAEAISEFTGEEGAGTRKSVVSEFISLLKSIDPTRYSKLSGVTTKGAFNKYNPYGEEGQEVSVKETQIAPLKEWAEKLAGEYAKQFAVLSNHREKYQTFTQRLRALEAAQVHLGAVYNEYEEALQKQTSGSGELKKVEGELTQALEEEKKLRKKGKPESITRKERKAFQQKAAPEASKRAADAYNARLDAEEKMSDQLAAQLAQEKTQAEADKALFDRRKKVEIARAEREWLANNQLDASLQNASKYERALADAEKTLNEFSDHHFEQATKVVAELGDYMRVITDMSDKAMAFVKVLDKAADDVDNGLSDSAREELKKVSENAKALNKEIYAAFNDYRDIKENRTKMSPTEHSDRLRNMGQNLSNQNFDSRIDALIVALQKAMPGEADLAFADSETAKKLAEAEAKKAELTALARNAKAGGESAKNLLEQMLGMSAEDAQKTVAALEKFTAKLGLSTETLVANRDVQEGVNTKMDFLAQHLRKMGESVTYAKLELDDFSGSVKKAEEAAKAEKAKQSTDGRLAVGNSFTTLKQIARLGKITKDEDFAEGTLKADVSSDTAKHRALEKIYSTHQGFSGSSDVLQVLKELLTDANADDADIKSLVQAVMEMAAGLDKLFIRMSGNEARVNEKETVERLKQIGEKSPAGLITAFASMGMRGFPRSVGELAGLTSKEHLEKFKALPDQTKMLSAIVQAVRKGIEQGIRTSEGMKDFIAQNAMVTKRGGSQKPLSEIMAEAGLPFNPGRIANQFGAFSLGTQTTGAWAGITDDMLKNIAGKVFNDKDLLKKAKHAGQTLLPTMIQEMEKSTAKTMRDLAGVLQYIFNNFFPSSLPKMGPLREALIKSSTFFPVMVEQMKKGTGVLYQGIKQMLGGGASGVAEGLSAMFRQGGAAFSKAMNVAGSVLGTAGASPIYLVKGLLAATNALSQGILKAVSAFGFFGRIIGAVAEPVRLLFAGLDKLLSVLGLITKVLIGLPVKVIGVLGKVIGELFGTVISEGQRALQSAFNFLDQATAKIRDLRRDANISGISVKDYDRLTRTMEMLGANGMEVQQAFISMKSSITQLQQEGGIGEMSEIFASIGIDLQQIHTMNPVDIFMSIVSAVRSGNISLQYQERLLQTIGAQFGSLRGVLMDDTVNIKEAMIEASKVPFVTDETVLRAQRIQKTIIQIKQAFERIRLVVVEEVMEASEGWLDDIQTQVPNLLTRLVAGVRLVTRIVATSAQMVVKFIRDRYFDAAEGRNNFFKDLRTLINGVWSFVKNSAMAFGRWVWTSVKLGFDMAVVLFNAKVEIALTNARIKVVSWLKTKALHISAIIRQYVAAGFDWIKEKMNPTSEGRSYSHYFEIRRKEAQKDLEALYEVQSEVEDRNMREARERILKSRAAKYMSSEGVTDEDLLSKLRDANIDPDKFKQEVVQLFSEGVLQKSRDFSDELRSDSKLPIENIVRLEKRSFEEARAKVQALQANLDENLKYVLDASASGELEAKAEAVRASIAQLEQELSDLKSGPLAEYDELRGEFGADWDRTDKTLREKIKQLQEDVELSALMQEKYGVAPTLDDTFAKIDLAKAERQLEEKASRDEYIEGMLKVTSFDANQLFRRSDILTKKIEEEKAKLDLVTSDLSEMIKAMFLAAAGTGYFDDADLGERREMQALAERFAESNQQLARDIEDSWDQSLTIMRDEAPEVSSLLDDLGANAKEIWSEYGDLIKRASDETSAFSDSLEDANRRAKEQAKNSQSLALRIFNISMKGKEARSVLAGIVDEYDRISAVERSTRSEREDLLQKLFKDPEEASRTKDRIGVVRDAGTSTVIITMLEMLAAERQRWQEMAQTALVEDDMASAKSRTAQLNRVTKLMNSIFVNVLGERGVGLELTDVLTDKSIRVYERVLENTKKHFAARKEVGADVLTAIGISANEVGTPASVLQAALGGALEKLDQYRGTSYYKEVITLMAKQAGMLDAEVESYTNIEKLRERAIMHARREAAIKAAEAKTQREVEKFKRKGIFEQQRESLGLGPKDLAMFKFDSRESKEFVYEQSQMLSNLMAEVQDQAAEAAKAGESIDARALFVDAANKAGFEVPVGDLNFDNMSPEEFDRIRAALEKRIQEMGNKINVAPVVDSYIVKSVGSALQDTLSGMIDGSLVEGMHEARKEAHAAGVRFNAWMHYAAGIGKKIFTDVSNQLTQEFTASLQTRLKDSLTSAFGETMSTLSVGIMALGSFLLSRLQSSASAVHESVDSAIESTEEIRGVISGSTTVAIKEVAETLHQANRPIVERADIIIDILRRHTGSGLGVAPATARP